MYLGMNKSKKVEWVGGKGKKIAATFSRIGQSMNSELGILRKETDRFLQGASYKSESAWKFPVA